MLETRRFFKQRIKIDEDRTVVGFISYSTESSPIPKRDGTTARFRETLSPFCFSDSIKNGDVQILLNHESGKILGSTKNGNVTLTESDGGVSFRVKLDHSELADEVIRGLKSRVFNGASPAFYIRQDRWPSDNFRVIEAAELLEISIVNTPCYQGTCTSLQASRSKEEDSNREFIIYYEPKVQKKWRI